MSYHVPILADEVIRGLNVGAGLYLDCTLGGGGHSERILRAHPEARLIAFDKDLDAIRYNQRLVGAYPDRVTLVHCDHTDARRVLDDLGVDRLDGVLMDLGLSSHQIDTRERGFSYSVDAPLDMRMNTEDVKTAAEVVNGYSAADLERILRDYGEEPFARKIAARIVEERALSPIETTLRLARITESCVPAKLRAKQGHPAKRTFQAIRIEVNGELISLKQTVDDLVDRLASGGRMAVLTFHSLEDRIIKQEFRLMATDCICDKSLPVCVCNHRATVRILNNKPIVADAAEIAVNPRAASAKLRMISKI